MLFSCFQSLRAGAGYGDLWHQHLPGKHRSGIQSLTPKQNSASSCFQRPQDSPGMVVSWNPLLLSLYLPRVLPLVALAPQHLLYDHGGQGRARLAEEPCRQPHLRAGPAPQDPGGSSCLTSSKLQNSQGAGGFDSGSCSGQAEADKRWKPFGGLEEEGS